MEFTPIGFVAIGQDLCVDIGPAMGRVPFACLVDTVLGSVPAVNNALLSCPEDECLAAVAHEKGHILHPPDPGKLDLAAEIAADAAAARAGHRVGLLKLLGRIERIIADMGDEYAEVREGLRVRIPKLKEVAS